jgi:hypothetical protein
MVLSTRVGQRRDSLDFKGWTTRWERSEITGAPVARYTAEPWDSQVPFFRELGHALVRQGAD